MTTSKNLKSAMEHAIIIPNYKHDFNQYMYQLQQATSLCDVEVECHDGVIPVHKLVLLSCGSAYLLEQLTTDNQTSSTGSMCCISLKDYPMSAVGKLIQGLYTGEITIDEDNVMPILNACRFLGLDKFETSVLNLIAKEFVHMNQNNVNAPTNGVGMVQNGEDKVNENNGCVPLVDDTTKAEHVHLTSEVPDSQISQSDDNFAMCNISSRRQNHRRRSHRCGSGSFSSSSENSDQESPHLGGHFRILPSSTCQWDVFCLQSLGISYCETNFSSPLDVLNLIFEKTDNFGPLSESDQVHLKHVINSINFSMPVEDLHQLTTDKRESVLIPVAKEIETDLHNLRKQVDLDIVNPVNFINAVQVMIAYQDTHFFDKKGYRQSLGGVPQEMFVDIFREFCKLCKLLPLPGSAFVGKTEIHFDQRVQVTARADIVLIPGAYANNVLSKTVTGKRREPPVVSIVKVKSLKHSMGKNVSGSSPSTSSSDDSGHEMPGHPKPAIRHWITSDALAQHGGELLLLDQYFTKQLEGKNGLREYRPGIIVFGTEVTFTVLEIKTGHLTDLENKSLGKATIYYSKPKDLLVKKDRDMLVEAFIRLNKGWVD